MTPNVFVANARSEDIYRVLDEKLVPALLGEPLAIAAGAMLMLMITQMKPDISGDELTETIIGASAWIVTKIASFDASQTVN